MQNNLQDIESILETGGMSALKTFIEESTVRLHELMERGTLEDIKADLQYRARVVDWLKTKASTEQEESFLIGYYCGILSECEEVLRKRFREEGERKTCDALNSLNIPGLKNIIRVIRECPGIGHRRLSKITGVDEATLAVSIDILAQCHAVAVSQPFQQRYYQATPAGLKYAGFESEGDRP